VGSCLCCVHARLCISVCGLTIWLRVIVGLVLDPVLLTSHLRIICCAKAWQASKPIPLAL
jgi:hypothetical protein